MAQIVEELILYDKFTNTFTSYTRQVQQASSVTRTAQAATQNLATDQRAAATSTETVNQSTKKFTTGQRSAAAATNSLTAAVKRLAAGYLSLQGLKAVLNLSDTIASTTARLEMMNDGLQTTAELNNRIYESAMRTGSSYSETANLVAQLGNLAGDAFSSSQEILDFAEQINKQIVLSGASAQAASEAIYQLTQGLSSGMLRGEELNSVMEQTPKIAQTIAKYLGMSTGELREFASQGKLTAEVVKGALLGAAEETNAEFEKMPMTWSRVFNNFQTILLQLFQPVLGAVNGMAAQAQSAMEWVASHGEGVMAVLAGIGAAAAVAGAKMVAAATMSAFSWAAANLPLLLIAGSIAAIIYAALKAGVTFQEIGGVIGGVFGVLYAFIMNGFIIPIHNAFASIANFIGNIFTDPIAAIKVLFFDMALAVLEKAKSLAHGIEDLINLIPGVEVNITSSIDNLVEKTKSARQKVIEESGYTEYVKPWEYKDFKDSFLQGSELGSKFGEFLENFDPFGIGSGSGQPDYTPQLDGISADVSDISKSTSASEEDIRSLVDVAERRYINNINLTSQTPVINITGANTGHTAADRQSIGDVVARILVEQNSSSSTRSTYQPVYGG